MEDFQTISWIFLATELASQKWPAKLSGISMIADGINHSIPTEKELQASLKWLISKDIILKQGKGYSLTDNGKDIFYRGKGHSGLLIQMWKDLQTEISKL